MSRSQGSALGYPKIPGQPAQEPWDLYRRTSWNTLSVGDGLGGRGDRPTSVLIIPQGS
ncbi:hypothetical protein [Nodosilinea sp. P-1105]|uniref:hypothetical protein n=1 Tax=Nodosilinea sp. P-1105 TaxID=2546229 RepID=UPI00146C51B6|nr:hypothetical protein [Nodosilinea sp. P-1105]